MNGRDVTTYLSYAFIVLWALLFCHQHQQSDGRTQFYLRSPRLAVVFRRSRLPTHAGIRYFSRPPNGQTTSEHKSSQRAPCSRRPSPTPTPPPPLTRFPCHVSHAQRDRPRSEGELDRRHLQHCRLFAFLRVARAVRSYAVTQVRLMADG